MTTQLLAVPNVSEGRDAERISVLQSAFTGDAALLDSHSDADHDRSVFTLAADPARLGEALLAGAQKAIATIEMTSYGGLHPAIGALDVCPIVWLDPAGRETARAQALDVGERIGELGLPVFLYGELATDPEHVERAYFRNGGLAELWLRMEAGELRPDFGPSEPHRTAGAVLATARAPLAAFNLELDSDDVEVARAVAAGLRESGGGLPGVRAIGLALSDGRTQISTNVHDPLGVPLGEVVERTRALAAPLGARPIEAEVVGLVPGVALVGYPDDVPIRGFDPRVGTIEARLPAAT